MWAVGSVSGGPEVAPGGQGSCDTPACCRLRLPSASRGQRDPRGEGREASPQVPPHGPGQVGGHDQQPRRHRHRPRGHVYTRSEWDRFPPLGRI